MYDLFGLDLFNVFLHLRCYLHSSHHSTTIDIYIKMFGLGDNNDLYIH